ncbi:MAG: SigB/SigF/SigG family RNA polymerase sigma factor [Acidimicrobiia bacterium]
MDPAAESAQLFAEYRRTRDRSVRNQLVEHHRSLGILLAQRFAERGEPLDDLVQVAVVGLLKAVERFDPDRGVAFSSFATPTILGELKRHFRDHTWSVRVPRRSQELHLEVREATSRLAQQLGHAPTVAEIAHELQRTPDEILEGMEAASVYRSSPLSVPTGDDEPGFALDERLAAEEHGLPEERVLVDQLVESLPEREQQIVRLRFFEDLTQSEIAARLGISQMHVSRLLRKCLLELRAQAQGSRAV